MVKTQEASEDPATFTTVSAPDTAGFLITRLAVVSDCVILHLEVGRKVKRTHYQT